MRTFIFAIFAFLISISSVFAADMRFIQVDGVLLDSFNPQSVEAFDKLLNNIKKENDVSFVVFTGNNIAKPNKENLTKFLKMANRLKIPYYVVLGQKDVNKQKHLGKAEYIKLVRRKNWNQKFHKNPNYVFEKNEIIFIVADGSKEVIPSSNGYYRPDVINWVDKELNEYSDKKVIIFQHYPIIPPINKETHYTFKAEEYLKMLSNHNNVKAIFAGHFGANNEQKVNGIVHFATENAPSYRVVDIIDYDSENPTFWSSIKR